MQYITAQSCTCSGWCFKTSLQVCSHTGPIVDPDKRDVDLGSPSIPDVAAFIQMHFKGIDLKPSVVEHCFYTVSVTHCIPLS